MNVSLILAHPNQGSFNHAIAIAAINALERPTPQASDFTTSTGNDSILCCLMGRFPKARI